MKIYPDLIRNVTSRVNLRTNDPSLPLELRSPMGGSLIYYYALLVLIKGKNVTPSDVHKAWLMWLSSQGGEPQDESTITDVNDIDQRVAAGLIDSASYIE